MQQIATAGQSWIKFTVQHRQVNTETLTVSKSRKRYRATEDHGNYSPSLSDFG